jgi:hypothetical protein
VIEGVGLGGGVTEGVGVAEGETREQQKYSVISAKLGLKRHPAPFKLQAGPLTVIPFGITFVQI